MNKTIFWRVYLGWELEITKVFVEKFNDKSVWMKDRRFARSSDTYKFFESLDAAKEFSQTYFKLELDRIESQKTKVLNQAKNICDLQEESFTHECINLKQRTIS